jgi:hypothetical protein
MFHTNFETLFVLLFGSSLQVLIGSSAQVFGIAQAHTTFCQTDIINFVPQFILNLGFCKSNKKLISLLLSKAIFSEGGGNSERSFCCFCKILP